MVHFLPWKERLQKWHPVFVYMPDQATPNSNLETTPYCNTCLYTTNRVKVKFMAESLKKICIFSGYFSYLCGWFKYFMCQTDVCYKKSL